MRVIVKELDHLVWAFISLPTVSNLHEKATTDDISDSMKTDQYHILWKLELDGES